MEQKRILVVDDNADAADSLGMVLSVLGANVQIAHSGAAALDVYAGFDPDAVLLDIGMPGMDGYQVAHEMRTRFPERRTKLIALTGWGQDEERRNLHEPVFDRHLTKPADIGTLQSMLASIEHRRPAEP